MNTVLKRSTNQTIITEKMFNMLTHKGNVSQKNTEMSSHCSKNSNCQTTMDAREGVGIQRKEHLCTVGGNICSLYGKLYSGSWEN